MAGSLTQRLRGEPFLLILVAACGLLAWQSCSSPAVMLTLVDWPTIAALAGLLALTKGLELGGGLHWLGTQLVSRFASERHTALCLVILAAVLSMVLTNDVALFFLVPLTLGMARTHPLPASRLVIFEALAVNAGSALTPIGNPQNLFLWQFAHVPATSFMLQMLPLVALMLVALLGLTWWAFDGPRTGLATSARRHTGIADALIDPMLLAVAIALYVPFLLATEWRHAAAASAAVLLVFALLRPRLLLQLDWALLLVFVLMFVDMRLLAGLPSVRAWMQDAGLSQPLHLLLAGVGLSQIISNVPAAIALANYSSDWRILAYGANVGGFGWMVGSLANLIALRLGGDRYAWVRFHAYSVPMLLFGALAAYAVLRADALMP